MRVCTLPGTLVRCLLDKMMVSSNHTITHEVNEERQSLVANTLHDLLVAMRTRLVHHILLS